MTTLRPAEEEAAGDQPGAAALEPGDLTAAEVADEAADTRTEEDAPAGGRGRNRALDGLRCLAVLAVMAFHTGGQWARGGSLGVDVFFVLSGFLITGLLVREWEATGRVRLGSFYLRRGRRLLPALLLVVAALLVWSAFGMDGPGRHGLNKGVLGTLLYFANWQSAAHTLPPLALTDHAWSLSIEEQFYLVWPLLLVVLLRLRVRRSALLAGVLAAAAVSGLLGPLLWHGHGSIDRIYYGTDTRAVALLVGAALGLAAGWGRLPAGRAAARAAPWVGAAGLGWLGWQVVTSSWQDASTYHGGLVLAAGAAAAVVASVAVAPAAGLARMLALPPLVAVGRISYGLYLWHWPVYIVLNGDRLDLPWLPTQVVRVGVTGALSAASYLLLERRLLAPRRGRPDSPHTSAEGTSCLAR